MQLAIYILSQVTCMIIIAQQTEPQNVILNYVVLTCVCQIDTIYYNMVNSPLKDKLIQKDYQIPWQKIVYKSKNNPWRRKCLNALLHIIRFFYDTVYFYMFPYCIFLFIWYYQEIEIAKLFYPPADKSSNWDNITKLIIELINDKE